MGLSFLNLAYSFQKEYKINFIGFFSGFANLFSSLSAKISKAKHDKSVK